MNRITNIADQLNGQEDHPLPPSMKRIGRIVEDVRSVLFPHGRSNPERARIALAKIQYDVQRLAAVAVKSAQRTHLPHEKIDPKTVASDFLESLPGLQDVAKTDIEAALKGDPAAKDEAEVIAYYPGFHAILLYRIAHTLQQMGVPYVPRGITEHAHRETGIDIHPGASVGRGFFIDHGTGVVIGETAKIGNDVRLYQGVTLGALSFPKDPQGNLIRGQQRHPTLEDNVTVYANATILGGGTTIGHDSEIGGGVWITKSIEPWSKVTLEPPVIRHRTQNGQSQNSA